MALIFPGSHVVTAWLIVNPADLLSKFSTVAHGRAPYKRWKRRHISQETMECRKAGVRKAATLRRAGSHRRWDAEGVGGMVVLGNGTRVVELN